MSTLSMYQSYVPPNNQLKEMGGDASSEKPGLISTFADDSEECLLDRPKSTKHDLSILIVALIFFAFSVLLSIFSIVYVIRGNENIDNISYGGHLSTVRTTSLHTPTL